MAAVRQCSEHGYFDEEACPVCGAAGERVLGGNRRTRLSKFLSGALRHFPDDAGIELDESGWADYDDVLAAVTRKYGWADARALRAVIATDPKGRFEREPATNAGGTDEASAGGPGTEAGRVRAAYGHSVDVDLDAGDGPVPDALYHGTAPRNLAAIREEGLRPMGRQQVHLSGTREEALAVGRRHAADPALLRIDAAALQADGHRIARRGPATYTVDRVPPAYLTVVDR